MYKKTSILVLSIFTITVHAQEYSSVAEEPSSRSEVATALNEFTSEIQKKFETYVNNGTPIVTSNCNTYPEAVNKYGPNSSSMYLTIVDDHYEFQTEESKLYWSDTGNQTTEIRIRPRNENCTLADYVYDQNKNSVSFHNNPDCDDDDYGNWDINVPSSTDFTNKIGTYDTDLSPSRAVNSPILVYGYGVLGTKEGYDVAAVFSLDTKKSRVTFLALCTKKDSTLSP